MAQAHLSSHDMSSVDREDLSSGGEEEETSQSRTSNSGKSDTFSVSHAGLCAADICSYTYSQKPLFLGSDLREESKLLGDQCASVDTLTEKADLSCHQLDGQDAKELEGEIGD